MLAWRIGNQVWRSQLIKLIGNTPLVYLNKVINGYMGRVAAKLDFVDPCSSFRDRTWYNIIIDAKKGFIELSRWIKTDVLDQIYLEQNSHPVCSLNFLPSGLKFG